MVPAYGAQPRAAHAGAVPYLELWGLVAGGWQMGRAALIAAEHLRDGTATRRSCAPRSPPRATTPTACCRRRPASRARSSHGGERRWRWRRTSSDRGGASCMPGCAGAVRTILRGRHIVAAPPRRVRRVLGLACIGSSPCKRILLSALRRRRRTARRAAQLDLAVACLASDELAGRESPTVAPASLRRSAGSSEILRDSTVAAQLTAQNGPGGAPSLGDSGRPPKRGRCRARSSWSASSRRSSTRNRPTLLPRRIARQCA